MARPSLGNQELLLLNYLADHAPLTVGEATEGFGKAHDLARTTVLTMMERLRKKGRLTREQEDGVYRYRLSEPKATMQRGLVANFLRQALGGSLEPFVAYLSHEAKLTDAEIDELQHMVQHLDNRRKGERHDG